MRNRDIIRRAARSLRSAKARTVLTSLAIAVGAFTITLSLAAGEGAREYADKLISSNVNPQALFVVKDKALIDGSAGQAPIKEYDPSATSSTQGMSYKQLSQTDIDTLAARSDVSSVIPTYSLAIDYLQFGGNGTKFTTSVTSYDPTIISDAGSGSLPAKNVQIADDEVVIPGSFVSTLVEKGVVAKESDLIGKTVTLTASRATVTPTSEEIAAAYAMGGQAAVQALIQPETKEFTYTVVAVTKQASTALTSNNNVQISSNAARAISEYTTKGTEQYKKYLGAVVVAKEGVDVDDLKATLTAKGYGVQTAKDLQGVIFRVVDILQGIVLGFGVVALLASVFGIINTQYISVLERTREIGLMKALGMRRRSVSRLFQYEAAWIGFLGGVIGAVLAVVAGTALNPWITEQLSLGDGNFLLVFQPLPIVIMIIALIVIAMLAGWFPARKAAKLDPIEALRTE